MHHRICPEDLWMPHVQDKVAWCPENNKNVGTWWALSFQSKVWYDSITLRIPFQLELLYVLFAWPWSLPLSPQVHLPCAKIFHQPLALRIPCRPDWLKRSEVRKELSITTLSTFFSHQVPCSIQLWTHSLPVFPSVTCIFLEAFTVFDMSGNSE